MKMRLIMLLMAVVACPTIIVGCASQGAGEDLVAGRQIPLDFLYAGNRYIFTGVRVADQGLDADTPSSVAYVGSTSNYSIYLIQGLSIDDAIALRSCPGGSYSFYKYERIYGQEEPAILSYRDSDYSDSGEIMDIVQLRFGPATPESLSHLDSVSYLDSTYEVYSIEGVAEDQAIALRITKGGVTVGFLHYYIKYVRHGTT